MNLTDLKIFLLGTKQKETDSAVISAAPASSELEGEKTCKTLNFGEAFFWTRRSKILVLISVLPAGFFKAGAHCLVLASILIVPYFKDTDFY